MAYDGYSQHGIVTLLDHSKLNVQTRFNIENIERDTNKAVSIVCDNEKIQLEQQHSIKRSNKQAIGKIKENKPSDETKVSFTVPAETPAPFHIRFRVNIDKKKGEWLNPLTWRDGTLFSPKLKVNVNGEAIYKVPPAVLLSRGWERNNVVGLFNWQHQGSSPTEGELRIFTLSGLTPSVEKGDSWANWLVNTAGQGLYGIRYVEIQFAPEVYEDKEGNMISVKWEDIAGSEWDLLPTLSYRVPSSDIFTMVLYMALNWVKSTGIKQLEDAFLGQFEQNKSRNTVVVKEFINEVLVKLGPVWDNSIVPYLDNNPNLKFILKERRESKLREILFQVMSLLKGYKLIQEIPKDFESIKPKIINIDVVHVSKTGGVKLLDKKDSIDRYKVLEGSQLKILVTARVYPIVEEVDTDFKPKEQQMLKIWFSLYNKKTKQYIDASDTDIIQSASTFITGPAKKIRPAVLDAQDEEYFKATLILNGTDKYNNALIEGDSSLHINVSVEQFAAHEDATKLIKLKYKKEEPVIVQPNQKPVLIDGKQAVLESEDIIRSADRNPELPIRRENVKMLSTSKSAEEVKKVLTRLRESQDFENNNVTDDKFLLAVMNDLGNDPTEFDITEIHCLLRHEIDTAMIKTKHNLESKSLEDANLVELPQADIDNLFINLYTNSKYNSSIITYIIDQVNKNLIEKKNDFLVNKLNIPAIKVATESAGLFSVPDRSLLWNHTAGLFKLYLSEKWRSQHEKPMKTEQEKLPVHDSKPDENSKHLSSKETNFVDLKNMEYINLEDKRIVEDSSLTAVLATFTRNILYENIGRNIPDAIFQTSIKGDLIPLDGQSDAKILKREWINEAIKNDRQLSDVGNEVVLWALVDYFRRYKAHALEEREKTEKAREANRKAKEAKQKRLMSFLETARLNPSEKTNQEILKDITVLDLSAVVVREIIKTEVDNIIRDVVPQITSAIADKVLPAVASGIINWVSTTIKKNRIKLVLISLISFGLIFRSSLTIPIDLGLFLRDRLHLSPKQYRY